MYAIIVTGGKQYKVSEGDVINVEKLDAAADEKVTFDQVIAVNDVFENAPSSTLVTPVGNLLLPSDVFTFFNALEYEKQYRPISVTLLGIVILDRLEQEPKADQPIVFNV
jgi:hypothetical protein